MRRMLSIVRNVMLGLPLCLFSLPVLAQTSPFGSGWQLDPEASSLQFQSVKKQSVIETSSFATLTGEIAPDGAVSLDILLDSVDTKVDLRNVRMRFLFFETFNHPLAQVRTRLDPATLADLAESRRKTIELPFTLQLHGVTQEMTTPVAVTLISDDIVSVATAEPILINVADFGLMGGLQKLQEAASVDIVPSTAVTFDFLFRAADVREDIVTAEVQNPASAALEDEGDFSYEACAGRFEILSRTGNIYFRPGSAQLDQASAPLLTTLTDIVSRCPDLRIEVSGHTDSIGSDAANQRLSERRAGSVVSYLMDKGIPRDRLRAVGYGEARPVATNDTDEGRSKNRRIEFSVEGS